MNALNIYKRYLFLKIYQRDICIYKQKGAKVYILFLVSNDFFPVPHMICILSCNDFLVVINSNEIQEFCSLGMCIYRRT